jgi:hypothetical protein
MVEIDVIERITEKKDNTATINFPSNFLAGRDSHNGAYNTKKRISNFPLLAAYDSSEHYPNRSCSILRYVN